MNNKFKRALSSILAFVMVISVLTVMNVSSVFADDTTASNSATFTNDYTASAGDTVKGFNDTDIVITALQDMSSNQPSSTNYNFTLSSDSTVPGRPSFKFYAVQDGTLTITHAATESTTKYVYLFKLDDDTAYDDIELSDSAINGTYSILVTTSGDSTTTEAELEAGCSYVLASRGTQNRFTGIDYVVAEESDTSYSYAEGTYYYYASDDDLAANEENGANDTSVFTISDTVTGTGSLADSADFEINGKTYTLSKRTANGAHSVTVKVPSNVDGATLYLVGNSSGTTSDRSIVLSDGSSYSVTKTVNGNTGTLVSYEDLAAGSSYTLSCSSNWGFSLLVLVTQTVEAADSCELYNGDSAVSASGSIDTVYTGVEIDGTVYDASTFGYTYVYGYAIADDSLTEDQVAALADYSLKLVTANAE